MNILPSSAWAILEPASKTYMHQPAYNIIQRTIKSTRTEAISSYVGVGLLRDNVWKQAKRRGFICRRIRVVGFSYDTPDRQGQSLANLAPAMKKVLIRIHDDCRDPKTPNAMNHEIWIEELDL